MPNLINQMRNGLNPTTPPQQPTLDASINQVRGMMQYLRSASNQEAAMKQLIENNPQFGQVVNMMKATPGGLEGVARKMAAAQGINLNDLINKLQA